MELATSPHDLSKEALKWVRLMQTYAFENNWQITISHSAKGGLSVSVAHDAPAPIGDHGKTVSAGARQIVFEDGAA